VGECDLEVVRRVAENGVDALRCGSAPTSMHPLLADSRDVSQEGLDNSLLLIFETAQKAVEALNFTPDLIDDVEALPDDFPSVLLRLVYEEVKNVQSRFGSPPSSRLGQPTVRYHLLLVRLPELSESQCSVNTLIFELLSFWWFPKDGETIFAVDGGGDRRLINQLPSESSSGSSWQVSPKHLMYGVFKTSMRVRKSPVT